MKRSFVAMALLAVTVLLSGCATRWEPECTAVANVGNQDMTVQIYGVRKMAHQTQFRAGYPFGWQWVSKANFKSDSCKKE